MDTTYEMRKAGMNVRALNVPFEDNRELGQREMLTFRGRTIGEARAKADAYLETVHNISTTARAVAMQTREINQRIAALERGHSGNRTEAEPVNEHTKVDRNSGTIRQV